MTEDRAAPRTEAPSDETLATAERLLAEMSAITEATPCDDGWETAAIFRAAYHVALSGEAAAAPALDPDAAKRIAGLREVIRAGHDWHDVTALWSVQNDLDWLLVNAERFAARPTSPGDRDPAEPPEGTRLILVQQDLAGFFGTRSERGNRLSFEWGEPDEHGWYSPLITEHVDDNLAGDRDRREARITAVVRERFGHNADADDLIRALLAAPGQAGPSESGGE